MADPPVMAPLVLETLVHLEGLGGGDAIASALADPELVSVGTQEDALLEQSIGLPVHLVTAPADTLARFSFPAGTRLVRCDVRLPREDLPRSLRVRAKVTVRAVVVPVAAPALTRPRPDEVRIKAEAWLFLVGFSYTCHFSVDERFRDHPDAEREAAARVEQALEARIEAEALRLAAAEELGPIGYLSLLPPPGGDRLEPLRIALPRDGAAEGRAASLRRALEVKQKRTHAVEVLEAVAEPLHVGHRKGRRPPIVGRDPLVARLRTLLSPAAEGHRGCVLLAGGAGVGKSALLQAFLEQEDDAGNKPLIYATSGAALVAGMSGLGQWQERVRRVMMAAATLDAVLWLDDLADLFTERGRSQIDVASAMRPFLEQGRVRVVAEVDDARLARIERRNVGFFSCFARVSVPPLDPAATLAVLEARALHHRRVHARSAHLAEGALATLAQIADRYLAYEQEPGRSVRLYEEVRAAHGTGDLEVLVSEESMLDTVSLRLGMPSFLLREDRALLREDVERQLGARVLGQEAAVRAVAATVCVVKAGLQPRGRPLASFLFVGPTGVGKTELARALADFLFGAGRDRGGERLVRFDMSEFMDPWAAERLIAGDQRGEGQLTQKVRAQPFCVVLLDEIEKAHPRVFDLLLQVLGEGRLTDAAGRTTQFQNAIVIMTSNLGAAESRAKAGFDRAPDDDGRHYVRVVESTFRPELVNRIDRIVSFAPLDREHRRTLAALALEKVRRRRGLAEPGANLAVSEAALDRLGDEGHSAAFGARALRRHVEEHLVAPVARVVSARGSLEGLDVDVRLASELAPEAVVHTEEVDGFAIALVRRHGPAKAARKGTHGLGRLSSLRRWAVMLCRLDRSNELREQVRFLVAQLGRTPEKGADTSIIGRLSADHHRLATALAAVDRCRLDLETLEELGLDAFFAGEDLEELVERADAIEAEMRAAALSALVALEPRRDEVTLVLQELDSRRGLGFYLTGLARSCERRRLEIEAHVDRDADRRGHDGWPAERRWGPPRTPAELLERLRVEDREPISVMLRIRGKDAILLALECGLHRDDVPSAGGESTYFEVSLVALRTNFASREWARVEPWNPVAFPERTRIAPARRYRVGEVALVGGYVTYHPKPEYFARLDEIHTLLLVAAERGRLDRHGLFQGTLADQHDEVRAILREQGLLAAIKRHREITGSSLVEAKAACEAMRDDEP